MKYTIRHKVASKWDFVAEEAENDAAIDSATDSDSDEDDTGSSGPITWDDCPLTVKSHRSINQQNI